MAFTKQPDNSSLDALFSQPQTYQRLLLALAASVMLIIILMTLYSRNENSHLPGIDTVIGNGFPTLMVFTSPFCDVCTLQAPLVNNLQSTFDGAWNFLTVDIHTNDGRELRRNYGFNFTPEYVLFDDNGAEIWRGHTPPDTDALVQIIP